MSTPPLPPLDGDAQQPIDLNEGFDESGQMVSSKIQSFGERKRHEDSWNRTPNTTGTGAIHCKSFFCKLRPDALEYLDQQINEWLDAHPQYEVKFVSSASGELKGKVTEPAIIINVWV